MAPRWGRWYTSRRARQHAPASGGRQRRSRRPGHRRRLRPEGDRAGARALDPLSARGVADRGPVRPLVRARRVDREHARLQLLLPPAAAHAGADRLRELGRARGIRDHRRGRQRACHARPAARACSGRGGDPAQERRGQDGRPARRQPRPALAADRDSGRRRRPAERLGGARRGGPGRTAGDDPPRDGAPGAASREPARPLAARGGGGAGPARALAGRRARPAGAGVAGRRTRLASRSRSTGMRRSSTSTPASSSACWST